MTSEISPLHLILIEPSSNDAETITKTLRNQGYAVRANQVLDEDNLIQLLEKQSWDMCIYRALTEGLSLERIMALIEEYGRDIPTLVVTEEHDENTIIKAMQLGLKDAVPFSSQERLYLIIKRELDNLQQRKLRKATDSQLKEAEKRCNLLLDSSQDAIAYIHDGMHVYANQTYVELFEYEDPDELLCMPVMDMIGTDNPEGFKAFLRQYSKQPSNNEFACHGTKSDGETFEIILTLSNASYDNEHCTQLLIRRSSDSAELEAKVRELSSRDVLTGLFNHTYFQEQLNDLINNNNETGQSGHLLFLSIDQFSEIEKKYSFTSRDDISRDVAEWLRDQTNDSEMLCRYGNNSFMLFMEEVEPDKAKSFATHLCVSVREQLFEIEGKTERITFSIGLCPVGEHAVDAKTVITQAHSACQRVTNGDGIKVYSKVIDEGNAENAEMLEKLYDAIEAGKMHLLFQPIAKLHGEERPLYQALLRMTSEDGEHVGPNAMFPVAQVAGLAAKMDRWVIMKAIKTLMTHSKSPQPNLFVNLSSSSILEDSLLRYIVDVKKAAKISRSSLIFQITANDAQTYLKRVIALNNGFKKIQVSLAITQVKNIPEHLSLIEQLKPLFVFADGDITQHLGKDEAAMTNLTEICNVAEKYKSHSVVPKVEDASKLAALWPLGVQYIQGYYLQPPVSELNYDFSGDF